QAEQAPAGVHRPPGGAVRLLHQRDAHGRRRVPARPPGPDGRADQAGDEPVPLPLRDPLPDRRRDQGGREMTATMDRRQFLAGTGALIIGASLPRLLHPKSAFGALQDPQIGPALVDPTLIDSWLAIGGDGTV